MGPHRQSGSEPAYRADIDGLRALAVLPVVLYHAGVAGFSGGFVGVDVFFVISGYLITGIIAREVHESRFSVWSFYERRARRILPALFAMVALVLVAASVLFLPGDFEDVPKSALAALFFLGNVWFFSQTGYFHDDATTMPLLHTWSLGVEEQFYIIFPIALVAIAAWAPRMRTALVWLAALGSLAWALMTEADPDGFAFYMLPPRGWELLTGSLLALGAIRTVRSQPVREVLSWSGIALIGFAVLAYDGTTVFPGLAAIPPVLGAALLIHCAPGTHAGRILSWKPAVWIGLLSYSLYLWHWPLIVFTRYAQDAPLAPWQSAMVVTVSVLVAWMSLKWIERPWRDRKRHSRQGIFTMSIAGLAGIGAACLALVSLGPWASRFPPSVGQIAQGALDRSPVRTKCLKTAYAPPDAACLLGAKVPPDALLWGDSHGVAFAWVLGERAAERGSAVAQRTLGSCAPILGYANPKSQDCALFNAKVIEEIENTPTIRTVYLSAFWAGGDYASPDAATKLDATIARLGKMGRRVVVIAAVPTQPYDVPRMLQRVAAYGLETPVTRTAGDHAKASDWLNRRFVGWREKGVEIIDPASTLFTGESSLISSGGKPLYFDSHHLTLAGARLVLDTYDMAQKGEAVGADRDNR